MRDELQLDIERENVETIIETLKEKCIIYSEGKFPFSRLAMTRGGAIKRLTAGGNLIKDFDPSGLSVIVDERFALCKRDYNYSGICGRYPKLVGILEAILRGDSSKYYELLDYRGSIELVPYSERLKAIKNDPALGDVNQPDRNIELMTLYKKYENESKHTPEENITRLKTLLNEAIKAIKPSSIERQIAQGYGGK